MTLNSSYQSRTVRASCKHPILLRLLALVFLMVGLVHSGALELVPAPADIETREGALRLSNTSSLSTDDAELMPLLGVLAEEIHRATGLRLAAGGSAPNQHGIVLKLSDSISPGSYRLIVGDEVIVESGTYDGVATGTATLLQLLRREADGTVSVPKVTISDRPVAEYRGLMVDVGLRWCPPEFLYPVVDLCRLYKINFLGLHHNKNQVDAMLTGSADSMTVAEKRRKNNSYYPRAEMERLIEYARVRGVTMVPFTSPDIDLASFPEIFAGFDQGDRILEDCPEFWEAMDKKIGLLCELYPESRYVHLGAMAGEAAHFGQSEKERTFLRKHGLRDSNEYYIWLTEKIRTSVVSRGKTCMIWEGVRPCDSKIPLSKDVIICGYNNFYYLPTEAVRDGYPLINCSWKPLYSVQAQANYSPRPEEVFAWSLGDFQHRNGPLYQIDPSSPLLKGAQLCIWEETYESVVPDLRRRAPVFSERTWNPASGRNFKEVARCVAATDELFQRISLPVQIEATNDLNSDDPVFTEAASIGCSSKIAGTIRVQLAKDWGEFPSATSPEYKEPIKLTEDAVVSFQLFDASNRPVGAASQQHFVRIDPVLDFTAYGHPPHGGWDSMPDFSKLEILKQGVMGRMTDRRYAQIARETFTPPERNGHIDVRPLGLYNTFALKLKGQVAIPVAGQYVFQLRTKDGLGSLFIGGRPVVERKSFAGPATEVRGDLPAGVFPVELRYFARQIYSDLNLKYKGPGMKQFKPFEELLLSKPQWKSQGGMASVPNDVTFKDLIKEQNAHLALDQPVEASGEPQGEMLPRFAVDGYVDNQTGWHVGSAPQWLKVDLGSTKSVDHLRVVTFNDNRRYYQYAVDVSTNGDEWEQVVDMRNNSKAATPQGYSHVFPPRPARYVRITMLRNSANPGIHLNELMVFGASPAARNLYGSLTHSATMQRAAGVKLNLEKDGKIVASTQTESDGSFLLSPDVPGPYLLTSPENHGTVDGELIGVSVKVPDFLGPKTISVISAVDKVKP